MIARLNYLLILLLLSQLSFSQEFLSDSSNSFSPQQEVQDATYFQLQAKRSGSPSIALKYLYQALALRTNKQDDNWEADLRINISSSLFRIGETQQAFSQLLTAEKLYKSAGNISSQGEVFSKMANFYLHNEAWADAEKNYKTALGLQQLAGEHKLAAKASLFLADISLHKKDLGAAIKHLSYSQKLYESLEDKNGIANTFVKFSEVYRLQKSYSKAEQLIIKRTLPLFRSTGYLAGRVDCFDALGKIYRSQNRNSEAKWFFIQANTQARAINDQEGIITSLVNLGKVKVNIGDYNLAKRDFKEAEALANKKGDLLLMASVKNAYSELYERQGNKIGALNASEKSEDLTDSLNSHFTAQAESAKVAIAEPEQVTVIPAKAEVKTPIKTDNYLILKIIVLAIVIFLGILLFLKKIK